jgi:hypothetical protein
MGRATRDERGGGSGPYQNGAAPGQEAANRGGEDHGVRNLTTHHPPPPVSRCGTRDAANRAEVGTVSEWPNTVNSCFPVFQTTRRCTCAEALVRSGESKRGETLRNESRELPLVQRERPSSTGLTALMAHDPSERNHQGSGNGAHRAPARTSISTIMCVTVGDEAEFSATLLPELQRNGSRLHHISWHAVSWTSP